MIITILANLRDKESRGIVDAEYILTSQCLKPMLRLVFRWAVVLKESDLKTCRFFFKYPTSCRMHFGHKHSLGVCVRTCTLFSHTLTHSSSLASL